MRRILSTLATIAVIATTLALAASGPAQAATDADVVRTFASHPNLRTFESAFAQAFDPLLTAQDLSGARQLLVTMAPLLDFSVLNGSVQRLNAAAGANYAPDSAAVDQRVERAQALLGVPSQATKTR